MRITRVFTGDDGQSHFEDLEVPKRFGRLGGLSELFPSTVVAFRETTPGFEVGYHTAPRRQLIVNLVGSVEIECGDGSKRLIGPGQILLADDTTGQGHISRDIEGPRHSVWVGLPDDLDLSGWRPTT